MSLLFPLPKFPLFVSPFRPPVSPFLDGQNYIGRFCKAKFVCKFSWNWVWGHTKVVTDRRIVTSFCKQKIEVSVRWDCWKLHTPPALAAGGVWSFDRSVWQPSIVVSTVQDRLFGVVSCSLVVEDFRTSLFSHCSLMNRLLSHGALLLQPVNAKSIDTQDHYLQERQLKISPAL